MFKVTLRDMLDIREKRVELQQRLISEHHAPIISCTFNIAGEVKNFQLAQIAFEQGVMELIAQILCDGITIIEKKFYSEHTGPFAYILVMGDAIKIKYSVAEFENSHPLGRLFDFDVIDADMRKISRADLEMSPRTCLLCEQSAFICARSRTHDVNALFAETLRLIKAYVEDDTISSFIAETATNVLLCEVAVTPKPGLVDHANSGAHSDMDFSTFTDSAIALLSYFKRFAECGYNFMGDDLELLFSEIRLIGIEAEKAMFSATYGVNTHKGSIFSIGNICAAYGLFCSKGIPADADDICRTVATMTASIMKTDFANITIENARTNGEKLYAKHGVEGIRGEAMGGFKTAATVGLPVFYELYENGALLNDAAVQTLLNIMVSLDDTNVLWRHDFETLNYVKAEAKSVLEKGGMLTPDGREAIKELDREFIKRNISPGGAADLLAVSLMLYFLTK